MHVHVRDRKPILMQSYVFTSEFHACTHRWDEQTKNQWTSFITVTMSASTIFLTVTHGPSSCSSIRNRIRVATSETQNYHGKTWPLDAQYRKKTIEIGAGPLAFAVCLPKGKFQQEKMRTTPSGSGTTCALAGYATNGTQTCAPSHTTQPSKRSHI